MLSSRSVGQTSDRLGLRTLAATRFIAARLAAHWSFTSVHIIFTEAVCRAGGSLSAHTSQNIRGVVNPFDGKFEIIHTS